MSVSRRNFLGLSTGLLASGFLPRDLIPRRTSRVVVVGAGAAGLSAAFELHRAGHDVRVFEARERPGGRIFTLRQPFSDGLYAEVGALGLISSNPGLEYAREFGLDLVQPSFDPDLAALVNVRGRRLVLRSGQPVEWPLPLGQEEQGLTLFQLESKFFRTPVDQMTELDSLGVGTPIGPEAQTLDRRSVSDLLDEGEASPGARELVGLGYYHAYLNGPAPTSLLQLAIERASFRGITGFYQVAGGNDRICSELAARLGDRVAYRSPVRALRQNASSVRVTVDGPRGSEAVEGDFVVLTPPPPVLRDLLFDPPMSQTVMQSLQELHGVATTRIFLETRSRFWRAEGLSGSATTDGPLGSIGHATSSQDGERGILESFTYRQQAALMAGLSEAERMERLRLGLNDLFPGRADLSERGASHAWGDDPWARCGFVTFSPGQVSNFLPAMREPQGRVYLAGDTVGGVPGYSHAAFASGRAVAARIIAAA